MVLWLVRLCLLHYFIGRQNSDITARCHYGAVYLIIGSGCPFVESGHIVTAVVSTWPFGSPAVMAVVISLDYPLGRG